MNRAPNTTLQMLATTLALLISLGSASAATPDLFATVVQPVGVAATQNAVFVSQPFCVNDGQTGPISPSVWQILKIKTDGTQTIFTTLPSNPDYGIPGTPGILSSCEETYLAVSTGVGGFAAGDVFATQGGHIYEFNGSSGALVRTFLIPSLEVTHAHTSLAFDKVGSFGNRLIVVGTDSANQGEVWTIDSGGTTTKLFTLTGPFAGNAACDGPNGVPCFESPDVAPLSGPIGGTFPGSLFVALPGLSGVSGDIAALSPPPGLSLSAPGGLPDPEAVHIVPPASPPCAFQFLPAGAASPVSYEFFNANFSQQNIPGAPGSNSIFAYKTTDFTGVGGQLLVTTEGANPSVFVSTNSSLAFTAFDPAPYNSEGSSFVQCVNVPPPVKQSITVEEFLPSPLDETHLNDLQRRCNFLIQNGSGAGVCTCGIGDSALSITGGTPAGGTSNRFEVSYFDVGTSVTPSAAGYGGPGFSGGAGDNTVRIINPTAANGNLCAMIYVFDDTEEMQTCCGCPVTPDGMRTLSVTNDLTFDFGVNKANLNAGVIDIVSSLPNFNAVNPPPGPNPPGTNGGCSPTGSASTDPFHRATAVSPTNGLDSWITLDESLEPGLIH